MGGVNISLPAQGQSAGAAVMMAKVEGPNVSSNYGIARVDGSDPVTCVVVTPATIAQLLAQHWNARPVAAVHFHAAATAETFDLCSRAF